MKNNDLNEKSLQEALRKINQMCEGKEKRIAINPTHYRYVTQITKVREA